MAEARDEAYGFFTPYENFLAERGENAREVSDPARFPNRLSGKLLQLCRALEAEIDEEDDASFRAELEAQFSRCREFIDAIDSFTSRSIPGVGLLREKDRHSVVLHAAPLNVAEILGEVLFKPGFPGDAVQCDAERAPELRLLPETDPDSGTAKTLLLDFAVRPGPGEDLHLPQHARSEFGAFQRRARR